MRINFNKTKEAFGWALVSRPYDLRLRYWAGMADIWEKRNRPLWAHDARLSGLAGV